MVQLWIDITRQSLFECVREFALHDIETEFEGTKQVAQCILHRLVDCFIMATIMSEIPQFTNESPARLDDECVDAGEAITNSTELQIGIKTMRNQLLGVMALQGVDSSIMGGNGEVVVLSTTADSIVANASDKTGSHGSSFDEQYIDLNDALDQLGDLDIEPQSERRSSVSDNPEFLGFLATMLSASPADMYNMVVARKEAEGHPGLAYI